MMSDAVITRSLALIVAYAAKFEDISAAALRAVVVFPTPGSPDMHTTLESA
jgi:hypothetical protein